MKEDIKHFGVALMIVSANKMNAFNVLAIKFEFFLCALPLLIAFECFVKIVCLRVCLYGFFFLLQTEMNNNIQIMNTNRS